jgi:hypothetical protein
MSYGRNFEFRVPPHGGQRSGRWHVPATGNEIPIGAPVKLTVDGAESDLGLFPVELATGAQAPKPGVSGVVIYEYKGQDGWAGDDQNLVTYSDKDTVPLGAAVQVVSGVDVKVALINTEDVTFLNTRDYTGRTMVAGLGATPTLKVGDYLTPGTGDDSAGYWAETASAANAWLVITKVDNVRGEVEARLAF